MAFSIVSRGEAGIPTRSNWAPLAMPVSRVFVHHSVTKATTNPLYDAQVIDRIAVGRGDNGIAYSYLVHPSGTVIEGRGRYKGAHTASDKPPGSPGKLYGLNGVGVGICFIGNFEAGDRLTDAAVESFRLLVASLQGQGIVAASPSIEPHREVFSSACPGRFVMERLAALKAPASSSPVEPLPGSFQEGDTMFIEQKGKKPLFPGRTPGGYLDRENDQIVLINGASIAGDEAWKGPWVPEGYRRYKLDGLHGRPKGTGRVRSWTIKEGASGPMVQCDGGGTYDLAWS